MVQNHVNWDGDRQRSVPAVTIRRVCDVGVDSSVGTDGSVGECRGVVHTDLRGVGRLSDGVNDASYQPFQRRWR